ncbi:elongation of very long chain fatty acids protein 6 isoform X1 [Hyalella azteca]|uniref:Elongation of very long chain fatty acids protein n=1 Tax=Hyalella azteca TaxID=294128 RepID=A0A8B7NAG7_HYAAZ|nr:elongation of very long chain fatty acids protein 6 isoform X1 [Hyalella azteca]
MMNLSDQPSKYYHESAITKFAAYGNLYRLRHDDSSVTYFNFSEEPRTVNGQYTTGFNYSYSVTFDFEENFDTYFYIDWMSQYHWVCNFFIFAYLSFIFLMQKYMKNRERFELRTQLAVWNICLAVFSTIGAIRTSLEMLHLLNTYGFKFCVCFSGKTFLDNRVGGFWNWMFTLSKVPELGDTVFIVLRKQPLIFLHWYHHVTVLLYAWYSYSDYIATARWFVCMNYLVHSVMYSYYALKALKFKVSRYVAMFITTAQLAQMIMGAAVNIWAYQVKQAGNECHVSYENIKISLIMYTSYFVLFAHFFRRAYMKKPVTTDQKPITNGVSNGAYHYDKSKKGKFE